MVIAVFFLVLTRSLTLPSYSTQGEPGKCIPLVGLSVMPAAAMALQLMNFVSFTMKRCRQHYIYTRGVDQSQFGFLPDVGERGRKDGKRRLKRDG